MHMWVYTCMNLFMFMNPPVPVWAGECARQIVNKKLSFLTQYVTNQANSIKKDQKKEKRKWAYLLLVHK